MYHVLKQKTDANEFSNEAIFGQILISITGIYQSF
jgi:hypothetical protein